jgi:hypothetical protein
MSLFQDQPDAMLDALAAEIFRRSNVPAHNSAFERELTLFLTMNRLDPHTKFMDLPIAAQSAIAQRAAVSLELDTN